MENDRKKISLEILILFFKLIGLFPFGYSRKEKIHSPNRDNPLCSAVTSVTYNLILIALVCSLYIRKAVVNPNSYVQKLMDDPLTDIEVNLASVVLVILWSCFLLNRHDVVEVFDQFLEIVKLLENQQSYWGRRKERKSVLTIAVHVVLWIIIAWFAYDAWDPTDWCSSGWYFLYMFSKFVMTSCILQYTLLCYAIRNMAECLNTILLNFYQLTPHQPHPKILDFKSIRFMYCSVWDFTRAIDGIYGVPILIIITYLCYGIIYTLSMLTLSIKGGSILSALYMNRQFYTLHFTIGVAVCILIWSTTAAIREFQDTGLIVYRIFHRLEENIQLQKEVQSFSLELLHQHLEFSANGFFNLDYPFIQTVISAIISYGILLVNISK
ncbi:putative gustatory receptor 2a isoform X2 [Diachasma alloeum]|uniref:Gustatory receptor n=1 Tax=Diachasma alloeum TaxID=454923 RepID=A0A4E0RN97_9HYME|nr:putative gustatory receptor 2a isoform X2 [Diachasma alloeum]THK32866.1 gustatory receptor 24 [Diachasma alloeum]